MVLYRNNFLPTASMILLFMRKRAAASPRQMQA